MKYIYLVIVVFAIALQNIIKKAYNKKTDTPDSFCFSLFSTLSGMLFFLSCASFTPAFDASLLPYALGFGVSFSAAMAGSFLAIKYGSLSITMLVLSYSLIVPTFYGLFALNDDIGAIGITGIALLFVSLFLINKTEEKAKINMKWVISLTLSFIGNGMCSLVQKLQQLDFNGAYKNEFMICSLAIASVLLLIFTLLKKENAIRCLRTGGLLCLSCGLANGVVNYLVMVLTGLVHNSILFPTISAGGIVIGFISALFFYKEKLSKMQLIGYFIGTVSVILLNI